MYRRLSLNSNHIISALLLATLLFGFAVHAARILKPVDIGQFTSGVLLEKPMRLDVDDMVVGKTSVRNLFEPIEPAVLTNCQYFFNAKHTVSLVIHGQKELDTLQSVLSTEGTNRVVVKLRDRRRTIFSLVYSDDRFSTQAEIPIKVPPCTEIKRIFYTRVNSIIHEQVQASGQTEKHINLSDVFDLLLKNEIELYIARLDPIEKKDACFANFELLNALRGSDASGFDFGDYDLNAGLRQLLQPIIDGLKGARKDWSELRVAVRVLGYTDPIKVVKDGTVGRIELRRDRTRVSDWSLLGDRFDIRYSGCRADTLVSTPVFLTPTGIIGKPIRDTINDNCELGAVRAYVAMVHLMNNIGMNGVEYRYATGGIFKSLETKRSEDRKKRKVAVELSVRSARAN